MVTKGILQYNQEQLSSNKLQKVYNNQELAMLVSYKKYTITKNNYQTISCKRCTRTSNASKLQKVYNNQEQLSSNKLQNVYNN